MAVFGPGENMRMTSQKSESGVTLLSDRSRLGRGVQVVENDKNTVHLAVNRLTGIPSLVFLLSSGPSRACVKAHFRPSTPVSVF